MAERRLETKEKRHPTHHVLERAVVVILALSESIPEASARGESGQKCGDDERGGVGSLDAGEIDGEDAAKRRDDKGREWVRAARDGGDITCSRTETYPFGFMSARRSCQNSCSREDGEK